MGPMGFHGSLGRDNSDGFFSSNSLDFDGSLEWAGSSLTRVMGDPKQAKWKSVAHVRSKVPRALKKMLAMFAGLNHWTAFI